MELDQGQFGLNGAHCVPRRRSLLGRWIWVTTRRFYIVEERRGEEGKARLTAGHRAEVRGLI